MLCEALSQNAGSTAMLISRTPLLELRSPPKPYSLLRNLALLCGKAVELSQLSKLNPLS